MDMKIVSLVKHVPDTETKVKIAVDGRSLNLSDANFVMNPYDEYAVEEALLLKEKHGGDVTIISVGGEDSLKTLRQCLAMGADSAILVSDTAIPLKNPSSVSKVIAETLKKISFDLILCGKLGVGEDQSQIGLIVSEILNLPCVNVVTALTIDGQMASARREVEGGIEEIEAKLPCLITCQKGLNEPRYPTLKGIMSAKKKEIPVWKLSAIGLDDNFEIPIEVTKIELPPARSGVKFFEGELQDQVIKLVKALHEEAKII